MTKESMATARGIQFLRNAGVNYFVATKDGRIIADTFPKRTDPTQPPRLRNKEKAETFFQRESGRRSFASTGYGEALAELPPDKWVTWKREDHPVLADRKAWQSFCASVASQLRRRWGEENVLVDNVTGKSISILRVDPLGEDRKSAKRAEPVRVKVEAIEVQPIVAAVAEVPAKKRRHKRRDFSATNYGQKIRDLKPGQMLEFKRDDYECLKTHAAWVSFASSAMGYARRLYPDQTSHEMKSAGGTLRIIRTT